MIDTAPGKSVLFLDFDDVIALGKPYGGHHLLQSPQPPDIHLRLWHQPAMDAVLEVIAQARPYVVLTTTWLRFLDLASARELFRKTNAMPLAEHLHPLGEAPQVLRQTRLQAIDSWISGQSWSGPYAILDDACSGTGLLGSPHDRKGRVFLCEPDIGFTAVQVPAVLKALRIA